MIQETSEICDCDCDRSGIVKIENSNGHRPFRDGDDQNDEIENIEEI
jgi:hypothetical protein